MLRPSRTDHTPEELRLSRSLRERAGMVAGLAQSTRAHAPRRGPAILLNGRA